RAAPAGGPAGAPPKPTAPPSRPGRCTRAGRRRSARPRSRGRSPPREKNTLADVDYGGDPFVSGLSGRDRRPRDEERPMKFAMLLSGNEAEFNRTTQPELDTRLKEIFAWFEKWGPAGKIADNGIHL